jgi:hypothetical protein
MNNKQKIAEAKAKLNNTFPLQLGCFYYKGFKITREMFNEQSKRSEKGE